MKKCIVCTNDVIEFTSSYDDRYGYPGLFMIDACPFCGHKSLRTDFTPELLTRLYTNYYPRSAFTFDQYQPHKEMKKFKAWLDGAYSSAFRWVPKNVRVLDIGCGFGESLGYHKARGCDVYGVEADENIRRVAEKFGFNVHVGLFDPTMYEPGFFDYVTMDQVIEHVADPGETMRGIARVLKPGGAAILSTPNSNSWGTKIFGRKWLHWHTPYHLHFFSKKSMRMAAEQSGFVLEQAKTITDPGWLHLQWIHLLMYPKMGEPSAFWSTNARKKSVHLLLVKILNLIHMTKCNHVLTRLFDALSIGDNYVFILRKQ